MQLCHLMFVKYKDLATLRPDWTHSSADCSFSIEEKKQIGNNYSCGTAAHSGRTVQSATLDYIDIIQCGSENDLPRMLRNITNNSLSVSSYLT